MESVPDRTTASLGLAQSCRMATDCPGRKCVHLGENLQMRRAFCSRACISDEDCGEGGICFALGKAGPTCLAKCAHSVKQPPSPPCPAGLVCVAVGAMGEKACFVEPSLGARADRGAG